jgi:hypothetical protein
MNTTHPYRALTSRFLSIVIFSGALAASGALFAQPAAGNGAPPKPPAEALAACKTLSSGQECSFTAPHGPVKGTCWAPEGKPLACKPKDAPAGHPGTPKQ